MSNEQQKPQRDQQQQQGGQGKPGEQHGGQKPGQGGQHDGGIDR